MVHHVAAEEGFGGFRCRDVHISGRGRADQFPLAAHVAGVRDEPTVAVDEAAAVTRARSVQLEREADDVSPEGDRRRGGVGAPDRRAALCRRGGRRQR
jgi:hypothetical protein